MTADILRDRLRDHDIHLSGRARDLLTRIARHHGTVNGEALPCYLIPRSDRIRALFVPRVDLGAAPRWVPIGGVHVSIVRQVSDAGLITVGGDLHSSDRVGVLTAEAVRLTDLGVKVTQPNRPADATTATGGTP